MIDSNNEKSILDFYNQINKYDNDKWNLNWKKDCNIKNLCRFMRINDLKSALEISDLIFENKEIMSIIKNDINIQKKIIRNACKGILEDYLYILLKLIDLKTISSLIFEYIYAYYLKNWIIVLEKNGIIFNKKISAQNYNILEYLLLNDEEEFINLMNVLEEIPSQYLSRLLFSKCINKKEIEDFDNLFIKFRPKNINIESFSETSEITIEDIKYLLGNKYNFNINFSTFNFEKMIKFCRPSVVKLVLTSNEFIGNQKINMYDLKNIAKNNRRFDNLQILEPNNKFLENMANIFLSITGKAIIPSIFQYDNNIFNFCLFEFDDKGTIFNILNEAQKFNNLKKILNFPVNLINKDILFKNFSKILEKNILELPLNDIFDNYLNYITYYICKNGNKSNYIIYYSYFVELLDIIMEKQKTFFEFDMLLEKTIDSLIKVLGQYKEDLSYLNISKNGLDQNIMHILSKNKVFISEILKEKYINLLEILKNNGNGKLFKNLFNDKDKNSLTFLMYLLILEQNELFVEIYLKYKEYINPFIFNKNLNNILHYIIFNMKDDSTQKGCLDKFLLIIKDIILNYPNIIFQKNIRNQTPLLLIFCNENDITGPINLIFKAFSYETLEKKSGEDLLYLTLIKNKIFILRYLIEYHHININKPIKNMLFYPLNISAINSKIDLFELLIGYGANPFIKNRENLDTINYAMRYGNSSFLEHIYNMKISDICFSDKYKIDLVSNNKGYDIFIKLIRNNNINLSIINSKNETLLMKACENDNYELINILINYGANPLSKDEINNTALHFCCLHNSINSINILLQKLFYKSKKLLKKNLSFGNINDDTPLHLASKEGNLEIVQKLLIYSLFDEKKNNLRIKAKGEFLPVHYAIINDKIEIALFLIKALDITDEEIENIEKDSFYNKIMEFILSKNKYIETYGKKINSYIEKLSCDINELKSNYNDNINIYKINEINDFNDLYELKIKKINFKELLKKINTNNDINNEYQKKLLKYFNYFNKSKMINKIIELNEKGLNHYLIDLIDCLDKSNWIKYEKLGNIVNLFMTNIFPFIEDDYFQNSIETINIIINNEFLKDKAAFNFLSWIEIIIISISEDISQFPINDIILFIQQFYKIILEKLKKCNNNITGLEIISYPYANIKFYYFIKQLISILNYKNEELCLIQLKNINFMPPIILEGQEIQNDQFLIFHYSRLIKNKSNKLFLIVLLLPIFHHLYPHY